MKLATLERVNLVEPHPNADKLEFVQVLGYKCIVSKDSFKVGDSVIFIQPDTVLPDAEWAEPFKKYAKTRVKAVKLRGLYSMGLVIDPKKLPIDYSTTNYYGKEYGDILKVSKYLTKEPNDLKAKGALPFGIFKTDEERYQNIIELLPFGKPVDVTLKIDGSSITFYCKKIENEWQLGITSRTMDLKLDANNNYTNIDLKYNVLDKLKKFCQDNNVSLALRGEVYGNRIQNKGVNPHQDLALNVAFYSVLNLDTLLYENVGNFSYKEICNSLHLPTVPLLENNVILTPELIYKYDTELSLINGKPFEGVVMKHDNGSFKVINKNYDEKN